MRTRFLALIVALALSVPVAAQRVSRFEQLTVGAAAVGITASTLSGMATCTLRLETAQIRWRADGTAPTSAVGTLMEIGDVLTIENILDARAIQFIRTGASSGALDISCFPQP
jgi:hypothetical protein